MFHQLNLQADLMKLVFLYLVIIQNIHLLIVLIQFLMQIQIIFDIDLCLKQFLKNRYRVLLTRFRYGMVIWIPEGNNDDKTRLKSLIDDTYYLFKIFVVKELYPFSFFSVSLVCPTKLKHEKRYK